MMFYADTLMNTTQIHWWAPRRYIDEHHTYTLMNTTQIHWWIPRRYIDEHHADTLIYS